MKKLIDAMAAAYQEMAEKKMDPVGQADADIDNDGDVDKTDKYLHNRRKAIKKSMKKGKDDPKGENGETATMNPKVEKQATSEQNRPSDHQKARKKAIKRGLNPPTGGPLGINPQDPHDPKRLPENIKTADKKPETYTDDQGKKRTRMVPVDRNVVKKEEVEVDEALKPYDKNADFRVVNRLKPKQKTGDLSPAEKKQLANAQARLRNHGVTESFRDKLLSVLENREKHYKGAMDAEAHDDNWSPGAKKMQDDLGKMEVEIDGFKAADETAKNIANSVKAAPGRPNDSKDGDKNIVTQVVDAMKGLKK